MNSREPEQPLARVEAVNEVADFYAQTCPRLVGLLTSIGGSRADAEEVAQDAYVKLLPRWESVRHYDDPEAWVRRVAIRLLISRYRRARVARAVLPRLAHRDEEPPATGEVELAALLATLNPQHRAVVIMHYVLDLPVEQISEELGVPPGTVKSRLARARTALEPLLRNGEVNGHV